MVYLPTDVFSNLLSFLDNTKTIHKKKQNLLNTQLCKLSEALAFEHIDFKFFLLQSDSFNNNKIIKIFDDRYISSDDDDDDEYDENFFED